MSVITKEFILTCDHEDCRREHPSDYGITVDAWYCGNPMETNTCRSYFDGGSVETRSRNLQEHLNTMDLRGKDGYREYLCFWTIKKNGKVLCPKHASIDHVLDNSKKECINGAVSYRFGNFYYFYSHGSWYGEEYDIQNDDTTTNPVGIDSCYRKEDLLSQIADKQMYIESLQYLIESGGCYGNKIFTMESIDQMSNKEYDEAIKSMTIDKCIEVLYDYYEGYKWQNVFKDRFGK